MQSKLFYVVKMTGGSSCEDQERREEFGLRAKSKYEKLAEIRRRYSPNRPPRAQ